MLETNASLHDMSMLDEQGTISSSSSLTMLGLNLPDMLPRSTSVSISTLQSTLMFPPWEDGILLELAELT